MKKQIALFLTIVFSLTALALPAFATDTYIVEINGTDRLEITKVVEGFDVPPEEGFDSQGDFTCRTGATLSTLEDNTIPLVFHTIHDPENGSSSNFVVPDNYTNEDLNEYGQIFDFPKGGSFTFTERGMYYYDIQFADNTHACGYICVDDDYSPTNIADAIIFDTQDKPEPIPVVSKAQCLQIEEEWTDVDAYNIYDNNYIKLRDFAYFYSMFGTHTDKYFDVTWDAEKNAINLVTGKEYTAVGGEGVLNVGVSAEAVLSSAEVYLNGEYAPLTAYNINGNNYFKLRDLCEALDISISWWATQQIIYINNDYGYGTEFEEIVPDIR